MNERHVDLPTGYKFRPGQVVIRCHNWPQCMCGEDCNNPAPSLRADWLARGLLIATAIIAVGLIYVGLR